MAHTRELAFQISKEYERFSKYTNNVKIAVFFGGMPVKKDEEVLQKNCPHIVVGTPGRLFALAKAKTLSLKHIKHFILDECDKMLADLGKWKSFPSRSSTSLSLSLSPPPFWLCMICAKLFVFYSVWLQIVIACFIADMRRDVQEIFRMTPHEKQVMMFSATLSKDIRPICKKFMQDVIAPPDFPLSHHSRPPPWSPASAFSRAGSGGWWLAARQLAAFLYPIWQSAVLSSSLRLSARVSLRHSLKFFGCWS